VDLRVKVDNHAKDHRLRICFPTAIQTEVAHADGHFGVMERPVEAPPGEGWDQPPVPTQHQRYFVDLSDGQAGLAVLNRGLPEYEVLPEGGRKRRSSDGVALTLLRCVGYLSRGEGDMPTRPGLAGPPLPTPEAQCLGSHTFEMALVPHSGDWQSIYRHAYTFRAPVYLRRGDEHEGWVPAGSDLAEFGRKGWKFPTLSGDLPGELSFLTLQPETLALSAVKRAGQDDRLIIRFYDPAGEGPEACLQSALPILDAEEANLSEERVGDLAVQEATAVRIAVPGHAVKTVALHLERSEASSR
jgi:alpha-mannosidase